MCQRDKCQSQSIRVSDEECQSERLLECQSVRVEKLKIYDFKSLRVSECQSAIVPYSYG